MATLKGEQLNGDDEAAASCDTGLNISSIQYKSNEEIYSQIDDKASWQNIFSSTCYNKDWEDTYYTKGISAESRFLYNPYMLVGIYANTKANAKKMQRCEGTIIWCMPFKLIYFPKDNMITAYYWNLHALQNNFFGINTINAQDFGYKYITLDTKSDCKFKNNNVNISNQILPLNNFFYVERNDSNFKKGVNKISDYSEEYLFNPLLNVKNLRNKVIDFKLWKEMPQSINSQADFTYRIVFEVETDINDFMSETVEEDTVIGIYYKLRNKIKPNYLNYKMEMY